MTTDDIDRMAREAGWPEEAGPFDAGSFSLSIFAALVEAAERERAAKVCDGTASVCEAIANGLKRSAAVSAAKTCARLIRAR